MKVVHHSVKVKSAIFDSFNYTERKFNIILKKKNDNRNDDGILMMVERSF